MMTLSMGMVRGLLTLTLLLAFLGLVAWLLTNGKRGVYEAAAHLPLESDESTPGSDRR